MNPLLLLIDLRSRFLFPPLGSASDHFADKQVVNQLDSPGAFVVLDRQEPVILEV